MFYKTKITDHVRVPPNLFGLDTKDAVLQRVRNDFDGYISEETGFVVDVINVEEIKEGIFIPGDGAAYYEATFNLLTFKPEMQEVVLGKIKDIADFGAFFTLGPIEGMIHVSQTMDDYVTFSKEKVLSGKQSGKSLRINDRCRGRIIALSYKDVTNPKINLTMRQEGLGRLDWLKEEEKKQ